GFSTMLGAALFSLGLARWEMGRAGGEGPRLRGATRLALPAVQTILALIVLGGPNSSLPLLVLAGWVALGMAGVPARGGSPEPFSESMNSGFGSRGAAVPRLGALERARWKVARDVIGGSAALGLLLLACLAALAPVRSAAIIEAIEPKDLQDPQLGFRLARAEERNRWNPEVHLLRAAWLRERLTRLPDWDEDLFQRICATYLRASDLDPYDPVIVLRLAEVQSLAARPEEALESARRALALNPYSEELLEWIYRYAVSHGRTRVALEMVERRLEIRPESAMWWRRRYRLGQLAGFGHEAATALSVATTGAIRRSAPAQADPALAPSARN
ncbi:hypothetical protein IIC65_00975, partial [Candidatus Sumerlaeota bacterium]|nr:hypothetical protein [Candidatus Sumerlaeota bacterium]